MSSLSRDAIQTLWPEGPAWDIEHDSDSDKTLDGIAAFDEITRLELKSLESVRNPKFTPYLDELEREYGVLPRTTATEVSRRAFLDSYVFSESNGSLSTLQDALDRAGFSVTVYDNDPPVDPASILTTGYQMVCGGGNAYAGDPGAYCGSLGGYLLVNGEQIFYNPIYLSVCGDMWAGDPNAVCGRFNQSTPLKKVYSLPADPLSWPFLFFVGGPATRNGSTNAIEFIEPANIPLNMKLEFEQIILKYKPLFTWAGMVVAYV